KQFENGASEDGGQFEFGAFDDTDSFFNDNAPQKETKKEENTDNSDTWMTQLTQVDDPLQPIEKPQKKVNKGGQTMSQMQSNELGLFCLFGCSLSNKHILLLLRVHNLFALLFIWITTGTFDNNFLQTINSGLTGQQATSVDPFSTGQLFTTGATVQQVTPVDPFLAYSNPFAQPTRGNPNQSNSTFGATTNPIQTYPTSNDPFNGLGTNQSNPYANTTGPVPATYQNPDNDPFSDLNWN
ncbi:hypothetical protein RFI_23474, partial [Reticulomyxa filosa]